MARRRGREQSYNDYWAGEPDMQLPEEYDNVPMGQEATYDKWKAFMERRKLYEEQAKKEAEKQAEAKEHAREANRADEPTNTDNELNISMEDVLYFYANRDIIVKGETSFCICPFKNHVETTPSFSFNATSFHCLGCGKSGNVTQFVSTLLEVSEEEATEIIRKDFE